LDLHESEVVNKNDVLYKCAWSPFEGDTMRGKIKMVFVNGNVVYNQGKFTGNKNSKRLTFNKNR
jgi:dihydroorotase